MSGKLKKNKFMKTSEAANYLGVSRSSITNWVRSGELEAASTPGGHYLFSLKQLNEFANERGMLVSAETAASEKYRILAIDDDQQFREFLAEALEVFTDYELKECEDGMQGALLIGTWRPNLVIVDLRMPNMNGVEFCRLLKNDNVTKDVKVIVCSAYLSPEVRKEVKELGVDVVLEKPVRLAAFVATVGKLTNMELS
jgi:excisionase family DNA binding protein